MENLQSIGINLAFSGLLISCAGVIVNNILLDHVLAMIVWVPSNTIFFVYFYGRLSNWWDGHVGDGLMCVNYSIMLVSGVWGLLHV